MSRKDHSQRLFVNEPRPAKCRFSTFAKSFYSDQTAQSALLELCRNLLPLFLYLTTITKDIKSSEITRYI